MSEALADETVSGCPRVPKEVLVAGQRAGTATEVSADLAELDVPVC